MLVLGRPPRYCAWMLRCWEAPSEGTVAWRFSLEDPGSRERQGFASLEALVAFLQTELTPAGEEPLGTEAPGRG